MTKSIRRWALSSGRSWGGVILKVRQHSPFEKVARHAIWQRTSTPPSLARRSASNLEELISGRDGSHDSRDPRLIKSTARHRTRGPVRGGTGGNSRQKSRPPARPPASSFTGQIKTTAEQVIKQEIMNSIILFSV